MGGGKENRLDRDVLFNAYIEWYDNQTGKHGSKNVPTLTQNSFYERLSENFGKVKQSGKHRYYPNMRFNDNAALRVNELKIVPEENDSWDD